MRTSPVVLGTLLSLLGTADASPDMSVNAGIVEVTTPVGEHVGAYPYVALSLAIPTRHVTLVPTLGVEWSPELGAWGINALVVADFPIRSTIGVDLIAIGIHDQAGARWADAAFYAGGGAGVSIFLDRWVLSPSVTALHGVNVGGWTVAPALNLSHPL